MPFYTVGILIRFLNKKGSELMCPEEDSTCQCPCLSHKVGSVRITLESARRCNAKGTIRWSQSHLFSKMSAKPWGCSKSQGTTWKILLMLTVASLTRCLTWSPTSSMESHHRNKDFRMLVPNQDIEDGCQTRTAWDMSTQSKSPGKLVAPS